MTTPDTSIPYFSLETEVGRNFDIRPLRRQVNPQLLQEGPHRHNFQELLWVRSGHVFDADGTIDRTVRVGSSTLFNGQASWEVSVDSTINNRTYFVELQSSIGTVISPTYNFTFRQTCEQNAAIVNFRQNPIQPGG